MSSSFQRKGFAALTILLIAGIAVMSQERKPATSGITEAMLKGNIRFLSDDMLEGRGTGARGGQLAAKYIAAQLEAIGVKGAAPNGSYFQPVSLVGVKADPNTVLTISGASGSETFKFADDFVAFTGAQTENVNVDAELVFVGYGIDAPGQRWNDYKGENDYRGKILVMLVNDPPATTAEPNLFGGKGLTYYGRWTYKIRRSSTPRCSGRDSVAHGSVCRLSMERRTHFEWLLAIRHRA
jgi:hypothetical protein